MAKLRIDKFDGGLAERWWESDNVNRSAQQNQIVSGNQNPFIGKGFYVPGSNEFADLAQLSNISSHSNPAKKFISFDNNKYDTTTGTETFYIIDGTVGIVAYTGAKVLGTADTASNFPDPLAATGSHGAHTTFVYDDMVRYQVNDSPALWFFYRDNTDGDGTVYQLFASGMAAENYWSNSATGGFVFAAADVKYPIIAEVADNGYMYVAQASAIHKYDGTAAGGSTGTVTADVLVFESSKTIVDMKDYAGKMWILTKPIDNKSGGSTGRVQRDIGVTVWNRSSTIVATENYFSIKDLQDVYSIWIGKTGLYVFGFGTNGNTVLLKLYNNGFKKVRDIHSSNNGKPANRGAVVSFENGFMWQTSLGTLFYFDEYANGGEGALHIVEYHTDFTGGALISFGQNTVLKSFKNAGGTQKFSLTDFSTNTYNAGGLTVFFPPMELPKLSRLNSVSLYFVLPSGAPSANSITGSIFKNYSSTGIASYTVNPSTDINNGMKYIPLSSENCNAIQVSMLFDGTVDLRYHPQLYAIEIDYTPTSKLL